MSVVFELSEAFLAEQGIALDAADVLEGVRRGFLKPRVAAVVASKAIAGGSTDPLWAAIESDAMRATAAHDRASAPGALQEDLRSKLTHRKWLFLQLTAAYLSRAALPDPLQAVEMIYADFDYPPSIESFVRSMPLQPGDVAGPHGLFDRWRRFLESEAVLLAGTRMTTGPRAGSAAVRDQRHDSVHPDVL